MHLCSRKPRENLQKEIQTILTPQIKNLQVKKLLMYL